MRIGKKILSVLLLLSMKPLVARAEIAQAAPVADFLTTKPFANPRFYLIGKWKNQNTISFLTSSGFIDFKVQWPQSCRVPETGEASIGFPFKSQEEVLKSNNWFAVEVAAPSRFAKLAVGGLDLECSSELVLPLRWTSSEYQDEQSLEPFLVFGASTQTFRGTQFKWAIVDKRLQVNSRLSALLEGRKDLTDQKYFGPSLDLEYFPGRSRFGGRLKIFSSLISGPKTSSLTSWDLLFATTIALSDNSRWKMKPHIGIESSNWFLSESGTAGTSSDLKSVVFGVPLEISVTRYLLLEFFPQYRIGKLDLNEVKSDSNGWSVRSTITWALSDEVSWNTAGYYGSSTENKQNHSQFGAGTGLTFFF